VLERSQKERSPVRAESRAMITDQEEQRRRWAEHFRTLLNRPPPSEMPDTEPADEPLQVKRTGQVKQRSGEPSSI